jgi:hypothetical protein
MNFNQLVEEKFNFLFSKGFSTNKSVINEKYSDRIVILSSEIISLRVVHDRGQITLDLDINQLNSNIWFDFTDVIHKFAPDIDRIYYFPEGKSTFESSASEQLDRIVYLLKTYCMDFLLGDISHVEQIKRNENKRKLSNINYFYSRRKNTM